VSRAVARWPGTPRLASLGAVDEHAGTLTFEPINGTPFLDAPDVIGAAAAVGTALAAWRGVPIPDELLLHTACQERSVLADWRERALRFGVIEPGDISRYLAVMTAADEALDRLDHRPTVLAHRDLHDGQLLLAGDLTVGMLDLDTACRADPALDLGNLLAHIDLAIAEGRLGADTAVAASAALLRGAAIDSPRDRLAVDAYRAASRARLVAVHAFRPRTRRAARQLLRIPASIRSLRRPQPFATSR
jgi:aminoglycoside phosphotransferase (APT) family kinase protein